MLANFKRLFRAAVVAKTRAFTIICAVFAATVTGASAFAEPTDIVVRAISRDAKFIGDSMGGVRIILRDAQSGKILAEGVTSGGTGDTKRLTETAKRREALATPEAAAFRATIDIDQPRLVEMEAFGPLSQATIRHHRHVPAVDTSGEAHSGGKRLDGRNARICGGHSGPRCREYDQAPGC